MSKIRKISSTILILTLLIFSLVTLANADWQNSWYLLLYFLFFLVLLVFSIINIEKSILLALFLLPAAMYFNDFKTEEISALPFFSYNELPLNPIAIIFLFIIFLGITTFVSKYNQLKKIPLKYVFLLYLSYIIASVAWTIDKSTSLLGIAYFMVPLSFYILTYIYFSGYRKLIKLISVLIASSIIPAVVAFNQIITKQYFFEEISGLRRITGTFEHPNLFASYLLIILSISFAYYIAKKDKNIFKNIILICYSLILLTLLILTYSRSAWIGLALFLAVMTIVKHNIILLFAAVSPIILLIINSIETIKLRILNSFNISFYSSIVARKKIWSVAWREITKKPIFGHGTGSSEKVIEQSKDWLGGSSLPHNDFILYTLEAGIIGLAFITSYFIGATYYIIKKYFELQNSYTKIKIFNKNIDINFKILSFGILAIFITMIFASFFDSNTRRIITQISIMAILGSLFSLKKKISVKENAQ